MVEKQSSGRAWIKLSTFNGRKSETNIQSALLVSRRRLQAASSTWETQPAASINNINILLNIVYYNIFLYVLI